MKDIDFDELDRAVSSVLGHQKPETDNGVDRRAEAQPTSLASQSQSTTIDTANTVTVSTARAAAPLAAKRRGQFMDVMHPSADMLPQAKPVVALPEHTAPNLTPISTDLSSVATEDAITPVTSEAMPSNEPTAELDESQAMIGAEPAQADSLGDTPSISSFTKSDSDAVEPEPAATKLTDAQPSVDAPRLDGDVDNIVDPLPPAPDTSETVDDLPGAIPLTPFLADTKVDKRPLGGFTENDHPASPTESPAEVTDSSNPDLQSAPEVPLPRELQSDVVEVESAHEAEVSEEAPTLQAGPFATSVAAASEINDDGRVEGHPLFDTSTYHEPMAVAQHAGMSNWIKWALGLVICLAIGAGVGFFLFSAGI